MSYEEKIEAIEDAKEWVDCSTDIEHLSAFECSKNLAIEVLTTGSTVAVDINDGIASLIGEN